MLFQVSYSVAQDDRVRHVERYEVPAITVEDWIEKYSFVIDDLMPHRLRQIRINFNFQEEVACHYT